MNRLSSNTTIMAVVIAGAVLGMLAGWLLDRPFPLDRVQATNTTPTSQAQSTPESETWAVPTPSTAALRPTDTGRPILKIGSPAPDFSLLDRSGNPVVLSDLRGKVVVINFWASWCPPCRDEMPDLQAISQDYADEGLIVLGVNTTYVDVRNDALKFIDELNLTFPIVFDETGDVGERSYRVMSLPTSYWIDRQGIIRSINIGAMSKSQMAELTGLLLLP